MRTHGPALARRTRALDLAGFSIRGPNVCAGAPVVCALTGSGDGIFSSSNHRIALHDGVVQGMGDEGVQLGVAPAGGGHRLERLRVSNNGGHGIAVLVLLSIT